MKYYVKIYYHPETQKPTVLKDGLDGKEMIDMVNNLVREMAAGKQTLWSILISQEPYA